MNKVNSKEIERRTKLRVELKKAFYGRFDCYADTSEHVDEDEVIPAMTMDKFIEIGLELADDMRRECKEEEERDKFFKALKRVAKIYNSESINEKQAINSIAVIVDEALDVD